MSDVSEGEGREKARALGQLLGLRGERYAGPSGRRKGEGCPHGWLGQMIWAATGLRPRSWDEDRAGQEGEMEWGFEPKLRGRAFVFYFVFLLFKSHFKSILKSV